MAYIENAERRVTVWERHHRNRISSTSCRCYGHDSWPHGSRTPGYSCELGIDDEAIENARDAMDPPTELMLLINQRQLQLAESMEQAAATGAAVQREQDRTRCNS